MGELITRLNDVDDSYFAFVAGVIAYAKESPEHLLLINEYLDANPDSKSSDILGFIMNQPDFTQSGCSEETA